MLLAKRRVLRAGRILQRANPVGLPDMGRRVAGSRRDLHSQPLFHDYHGGADINDDATPSAAMRGAGLRLIPQA